MSLNLPQSFLLLLPAFIGLWKMCQGCEVMQRHACHPEPDATVILDVEQRMLWTCRKYFAITGFELEPFSASSLPDRCSGCSVSCHYIPVRVWIAPFSVVSKTNLGVLSSIVLCLCVRVPQRWTWTQHEFTLVWMTEWGIEWVSGRRKRYTWRIRSHWRSGGISTSHWRHHSEEADPSFLPVRVASLSSVKGSA